MVPQWGRFYFIYILQITKESTMSPSATCGIWDFVTGVLDRDHTNAFLSLPCRGSWRSLSSIQKLDLSYVTYNTSKMFPSKNLQLILSLPSVSYSYIILVRSAQSYLRYSSVGVYIFIYYLDL
jgi:hypothetical protein